MVLPQMRRIDDPDLGTCAWMETVSPTRKAEDEFPIAMLKSGKESSGEAAHVVAFCPIDTFEVEGKPNKRVRTSLNMFDTTMNIRIGGPMLLTVEQAWSPLSVVHSVRLKVPMHGRAIWHEFKSTTPETRSQLRVELHRAEPSPEGYSLAETGAPMMAVPSMLLEREAETPNETPGVSTDGVRVVASARDELYSLKMGAKKRKAYQVVVVQIRTFILTRTSRLCH
jgi:hypothetical protein